MPDDPSPTAPELRWRMVAESLARPYPVRLPMVVLVALVPLYIFIAERARHGTAHMPELALDRVIPVHPAWAPVYGALYFFLILLPIFVVRDEAQIGSTVRAYLLVWITAYVCFLVYPTAAPRTDEVAGAGFGAWGLRALYSSDPPYNCFPSLHVAHSFVSALTCHRVHRGLGIVAVLAASLVGLSTLFTKQHYVADVIAGILLALVAYAVFLRRHTRDTIAERDRRLAPALALVTAAIAGAGVAGSWVVYLLSGQR